MVTLLNGMQATSFWIFSENCQKKTTENPQIWIFLKNYRCKGILLLCSVDFLLFPASRVDFPGSLAQFVQELRPIKGSPPTEVTDVGVEGFALCLH